MISTRYLALKFIPKILWQTHEPPQNVLQKTPKNSSYEVTISLKSRGEHYVK